MAVGSIDAGSDAAAGKISIHVARAGDHLVIETEGAGAGAWRPTGSGCGRKLGLDTDPGSHRRVLAVLAFLRSPA